MGEGRKGLRRREALKLRAARSSSEVQQPAGMAGPGKTISGERELNTECDGGRG